MTTDKKININENQVIFKRDNGHKHDGLTSSLIDHTKYCIFDFSVFPVAPAGTARRRFEDTNVKNLESFIVSTIENRVLNPRGIAIQANTITAREIASGTITSGELASNIILVNNVIKSKNYNGTVNTEGNISARGNTGWAITHAGEAEFNNVFIRGNLIAGAGFYAASNTQIFANTGGFFSLGSNFAWNGNSLTINGNITLTNTNIGTFDNGDALTGGSIGGVTISPTSIYAGAGSWANANTPFYLDNGGYFSLEDKLYWDPSSNSLIITGSIFASTISGSTISGSTLTTNDGTNGIEITSDGYIRGTGGDGVRIKNSDGTTAGTQLFKNLVKSDTIQGSVLSIPLYFDAKSIGVTISPEDGNRPLDLQRNYVANAHFIRFYKTSGTPGESGKIRFNASNGLVVAYDTTSDVRLKTNIKKIENAIDTIKMVEPVEYLFIEDSEGTSHGFIAQDLYEVYEKPVYVGGEDPREDPWSIDYSKMVPIITAALKESIDKIEELESRMQTLEGV